MLQITLTEWPFVAWTNKKISSHTIGWIALAVCILSASTYNVFAKMLTETLSPLTLFFLSEVLTGFFVVLSFGFMPVVRDLFRIRRKQILPLIAVGIMSGTIAPILLFEGLRTSSAVNASLFGNMEMVFLIVLAVLILREPYRREHVLSTLAITAGILTISLRGFTEGLQFAMGDLLLILSSLSFAIGGIIFRRSLHSMNPHIVLFVRVLVAVMCFFLISPFIEHPLIEEIRAFPLAALPILLGFGFISRFLNVFSFYEALDHLPVTTVSLMNNTGIVTSLVFAWWALGEPVFGYHIVGGALIILGTILIEVVGVRPKHLAETHHRSRGPHL